MVFPFFSSSPPLVFGFGAMTRQLSRAAAGFLAFVRACAVWAMVALVLAQEAAGAMATWWVIGIARDIADGHLALRALGNWRRSSRCPIWRGLPVGCMPSVPGLVPIRGTSSVSYAATVGARASWAIPRPGKPPEPFSAGGRGVSGQLQPGVRPAI